MTHSDNQKKLKDWIGSLRNEFDPMPLLETIHQNKEPIIEYLRNELLDKYINPMRQQIESLRFKKETKESELQNTKEKINKLTEDKNILVSQMDEMKQIRNTFNIA